MDEIVSQIRAACARVAERSQQVRIDTGAISPYAKSLALNAPSGVPAEPLPDPRRAELAAFWLTLDAINFGSGWFPTLRKRPGQSGYRTVAAGITDRFEREGPYTPSELREIDALDLAATLGQDPDHELMVLFARSLNDLGRHIEDAGGFDALVDVNPDSALALATTLSQWECFADVSVYDGQPVPFFKRAQIAAADLARAGVTAPGDLSRLTMFADNLVPHVLRLDGILSFESELVQRIERGELIDHGSPEEVEIRACAVHAVELIVAERPGDATAAELDQLLWNRGQEARYKASPRHRSRCTAY